MKTEREKTMGKRVLIILAVCFTVLLSAFSAYEAKAASIMPSSHDNLTVSLRSTSELVATSNGYMRVFYDGTKINVEYYDSSFNIQSKKSIAMELNVWGGFYAGSNAYYVVEGQYNTAESDTAEVIRVIKYDTNWNKKGTAKITSNPSLFGGEVRYPFDYGCVEMTEYNGTLYIVTGHEGYVDPMYNQGHQGYLMIAVDTATMKGEIVDCDLWHSFAQYIDVKDSYLYVLEQSEGSRYTKLSRYNANDISQTKAIPVLKYGGTQTSARAISCYASVDDMAISSSNILCLGTSIDQSKYDTITENDEHNIYLTVTPISNFTESATTVKWLTNYKGGGKCFLGTKITKVNDNRFMISWEEFETEQTASTSDTLSGSILHYIFVDGKGNKLTKEFTAAASISDCHPIVKGSKIVYYASNGNMVNFYSIDSESGSFSKKIYRVAGENATWELKNGLLTVSGTGAISIDAEVNYRYPVSSTRGWYSYSSSDNCWKAVRDKVEKILIGQGLTSIPEKAFVGFSNLTEVDIKPGVKSIGAKAFYSNLALRKITIPESVTSIGEDALWTGYYWTSGGNHVVYATIYCYAGSYAEKYAKQENINYVTMVATPKLLSVSAENSGTVITWEKASGAAKYRVFYKTGNGDWVKIADTTSTSYTWTGAKTGTKYTFTVRCITSDGTQYTSGYDSTGITFTSVATPKISSILADNSGTVIKWGAVSGAAKYRVFYRIGNGAWTKIADTTSTSYSWTGAKAGTKYTYTVRCLTSDGKAYSSGFDSAGKSFTTCAKPTISSLENIATGVQIKWDAVSGAAKYRIFYKIGNSDWTMIADTTATSYTWTGAKNNTNYTFTVRCLTSDSKVYTSGYDPAGKSIKFLSAPVLASVDNVANGVQIKWNAVAGAAKYRVFYRIGNGAWTKITDTTASSYIWTGAKSNTKYTFTVRCISSDAKSYTSGFNATGKTITYLSAPSISLLDNVANGVQIKWGAVPGAAKYRVFYKIGNGEWIIIANTTSTSFTWTGAKNNTKYTFTVRCISGDGKSYTSGYNAAGKTITFLSAPKISSLSKSSSGITIKWGTVTGAAKYRVFYKTADGGWVKIADTTSTSYTWNGGKAGTKYIFTVRCISSDGNTYTSGFDATGKSIIK